MLNIVSLSLDSDPSLLPASAKSAKLGRSTSSASSAVAADAPNTGVASAEVAVSPVDAGDDVTPPATARPSARDLGGVNAYVEKGHGHEDSPAAGDILHPLPDEPDDDDFAIMTETQARRIVSLCEMAFDVEMTMDVVVAEANVGALARRVVAARSLAQGNAGETSGGAAGT